MNTRNYLRRLCIAAIAAFVIGLAFKTSAYGAEIAHMAISNTEENLLVTIRVEGAFTDNIKEAVVNGITTSFSYIITVTETRSLFPDKHVHEIKITNTINYDSLRDTFVVRRSWENYRPMTTDSFAEARKWMSEVTEAPVTPLEFLKTDTRYRINAKAELDKVTLPFFLNYIFFFVSLWDFETSWHSIDFIF